MIIQGLKSLFGSNSNDYKQLVENGAIILDVRTPQEFASGNIPGSINVPLQSIGNRSEQFVDKTSNYIVCCASGMRSSSAKAVLASKGFTNVHNAGSWVSLMKQLAK